MSEQKKKKDSIKEQLDTTLETLATPEEEVKKEEEKKLPQSQVELIEENKVKIENSIYTIVVNHRDAVQAEALADRYNSILNKYDYIVGDWGYDQLRLKGFFHDSNHRAAFDKKINFLEDYLYEFCNFGCAYFVLEKDQGDKPSKSKSKRRKKRQVRGKVVDEQQQLQAKKQKKNFAIKNSDSKPQHNQKKPSQPKKAAQPKTAFKIHEKKD